MLDSQDPENTIMEISQQLRCLANHLETVKIMLSCQRVSVQHDSQSLGVTVAWH